MDREQFAFFQTISTWTFATPKNSFYFFEFKYQKNKFEVVMDVLVEELVDKEVAKVVEQVNRKFTSVGQQKLSWRWSWMWCWMRLTRR